MQLAMSRVSEVLAHYSVFLLCDLCVLRGELIR